MQSIEVEMTMKSNTNFVVVAMVGKKMQCDTLCCVYIQLGTFS